MNYKPEKRQGISVLENRNLPMAVKSPIRRKQFLGFLSRLFLGKIMIQRKKFCQGTNVAYHWALLLSERMYAENIE